MRPWQRPPSSWRRFLAPATGGSPTGRQGGPVAPRHSFKTRLTLTLAVGFILAGAGLTAAQLLVLRAALASNIHGVAIVSAGMSGTAEQTTVGTPCTDHCDDAFGLVRPGPPASAQASGVLRDTMLGDLGLLAAFAAVTAGLAWWLVRRALRRIGEVTALAREISEHDLSRRLNLPGPQDEIRELADTIDVMVDRLERAFAGQERFVANASHELRGPLTATRAALEAPLSQGRFPDDVEPSVRRALAANHRSERLITALLQLARSQALTEAARGTCDLTAITAAMVETLAEDAALRSIEVVAVLPERPTPVRGHETLLSQAVFNLLDNAIRHNRDGGHLVLTLTGALPDPEGTGTPGRVRLVIVNDGPEFTPEQAEQLREPFHRGASTRLTGDSGGLGLGLALVDSIAHAHGGRLELGPGAGGGLRACLQLPAGTGTSEVSGTDPEVSGTDPEVSGTDPEVSGTDPEVSGSPVEPGCPTPVSHPAGG